MANAAVALSWQVIGREASRVHAVMACRAVAGDRTVVNKRLGEVFRGVAAATILGGCEVVS